MKQHYDASQLQSDPSINIDKVDDGYATLGLELAAEALGDLEFSREHPYTADEAFQVAARLPYEPPPDWHVLHKKQGQTFVAFFLHARNTGKYGIVVKRPYEDSDGSSGFKGVAVFPSTMKPFAVRRYRELHEDKQVEALMREFGTDEDYHDFVEFLLEEYER